MANEHQSRGGFGNGPALNFHSSDAYPQPNRERTDLVPLYWRPWHRRVLKGPALFRAYYQICRKDMPPAKAAWAAWLLLKAFRIMYWPVR
jgi:hypothetical protein